MSSEFTENYFTPCVKNFVSTVLLIDDLLEYNESANMSELVGTLISPVQGNVGINQNGESQEEFSNAEEIRDVEKRTIQIAELIKYFSKENLLVTPINPEKLNTQNKDECVGILLNLAGKADVIVLDWDINVSFSDGTSISTNELSRQLIERLNSDEKYRLVIIYTADNPDNISISPSENIEIKKYCKSSVYGDYYKTYEQLAVQITTDYLSSKKGLLSSTLLSTLTQLRQSTYLMLNSLNKDYDIALLYHRILLENPEKICDFCNDIIADEILSHISPDIIETNLHKNVVKDYIHESNIQFEFKKNNSSPRANLTDEQLDSIIECGYKSYFTEKISKGISYGQNIDFIVKDNDLEKLKAFSYYTTMQSAQTRSYLKLGCIVKRDGTFFLCLQPPCDSERIAPSNETGTCDNPQNFLFLKLSENEKKVSFYVKEENHFKGLQLTFKAVETFLFAGDRDGFVSTDSNGDYVTYCPNDSATKLHYICCLKPMFAQKIANEFAANISRVGIDQFEWLRLKKN